MAVIYDNKVKGMGDCVAEFEDSGMFILFGDNAPDTLKDYCYSIDVNPIAEAIKAGQKAVIDGEDRPIFLWEMFASTFFLQLKHHLEQMLIQVF